MIFKCPFQPRPFCGYVDCLVWFNLEEYKPGSPGKKHTSRKLCILPFSRIYYICMCCQRLPLFFISLHQTLSQCCMVQYPFHGSFPSSDMELVWGYIPRQEGELIPFHKTSQPPQWFLCKEYNDNESRLTINNKNEI